MQVQNQAKSWVKSWVKQCDRTMIVEVRKIALTVDNSPVHLHYEGIAAVRLIFIPQNTGVREISWKVNQIQ